jgi:hypothetical protein
MTGSARLVRSGLLAAALVAITLPAAAQSPRPYSLTLYDRPDYRGASVTFYGDHASVGSTGFADRARSAQVRGTWRVCEGGGYRNRCEVLDANVPDLATLGLDGRIGSAQLVLGPTPAQAAAPSAYPPPPPYARPAAPPAEAWRPPAAEAGRAPPPPPIMRPEDPPRPYAPAE